MLLRREDFCLKAPCSGPPTEKWPQSIKHKVIDVGSVSVLVLVATKRFLLLSHRSRRSVTEHQLMHDRGRNIQSLKRLFWLSSAIEGLHTAQSRSASVNPVKVPNLTMNPALDSAQPAVKSLLRGFFNPYLTQLPEPEA